MKIIAALAALVLIAATPPQDPGMKRVEDLPPRPGPKLPADTSSSCCEEGRARPWPLYNKGVQWTQPLEAASRKARETGKLLMIFHLVGDMDKEGC